MMKWASIQLKKVAGNFNPRLFNPRLFNPRLFNPRLFKPRLFKPKLFKTKIFNGKLHKCNITQKKAEKYHFSELKSNVLLCEFLPKTIMRLHIMICHITITNHYGLLRTARTWPWSLVISISKLFDWILEEIAYQIYLLNIFVDFLTHLGVHGTLTQIKQTSHCWFEAWSKKVWDSNVLQPWKSGLWMDSKLNSNFWYCWKCTFNHRLHKACYEHILWSYFTR